MLSLAPARHALLRAFSPPVFRFVHGMKLEYSGHGEPEDVLRVTSFPLTTKLEKDQVMVQMEAAPVNPSDINQIQGTYPKKPELPATGGNEGSGRVVNIGEGVRVLKPGDRVIPSRSCLGTWRTHLVGSEDDLLRVPSDIPSVLAATMSVNPCTALRMLEDFETLKEGDTIIQNGSNSGVGQAVIQIARTKGVNSVCIVRDREDLAETEEYLTKLGASLVLSESQATSPDGREMIKAMKKPSLGLNCVGGRSALTVMRNLANHGTMVTYGGMSRKPLTVPTGSLIFNDIKVVGFWMTRWNEMHDRMEREEMLSTIADLIRTGNLELKVETNRIEDFSRVFETTKAGFTGYKQVFQFE
eukprot:m.71150 g.71150  ORF g.71150 m.71150 type:complete len:357 (-) comp12215_c0_seq4:2536-3606(-)